MVFKEQLLLKERLVTYRTGDLPRLVNEFPADDVFSDIKKT